jgi:hypothetical protein
MTGTGPQAGWYDDPSTPGRKRYWDGSTWSDATWSPDQPAANPDPSIPFQPPSPGPVGGPGYRTPAPTGLLAFGGTDVGDWLTRSFKVLWNNRLPVAVLTLLPIPVYLVMVAVTYSQLGDRRFDDLFQPSSLVAIGAVGVVALLISVVSLLALSRCLYDAHRGMQPTIGSSLTAGLTRLPRYIGLQAIVVVVMGLVVALVSAPILLAAVADNPIAAPGVLLTVLLTFASVPFVAWFWVKLGGYTSVAAVAVPKGTSALSASWNLSRGRFWQTFARLVIAAVLAYFLSSIVQVFSQGLVPLLFSDVFEVDDSGQLVDEFNVLSDALPSLGLAMLFTAASVLAGLIPQVIKTSAVAAMWHDGT